MCFATLPIATSVSMVGAGLIGSGSGCGEHRLPSCLSQHHETHDHGHRSERGAATQGRMMSLFRTASQRGIDALDYLVALARAPDPATVAFFTQ